jgi:hypothetical protein
LSRKRAIVISQVVGARQDLCFLEKALVTRSFCRIRETERSSRQVLHLMASWQPVAYLVGSILSSALDHCDQYSSEIATSVRSKEFHNISSLPRKLKVREFNMTSVILFCESDHIYERRTCATGSPTQSVVNSRHTSRQLADCDVHRPSWSEPWILSRRSAVWALFIGDARRLLSNNSR